MVKKCEQCGAPAVDPQSLFCNVCGGYVRDTPETTLPVCRACGVPAPDEQSVFCTRCGLTLVEEPEDRYPVCTSCGSVVPDEHAIFCNRCGKKILSEPVRTAPVCASCGVPAVDDQTLFCNRCGTPLYKPATAAKIQKKAPGSVIITKKKHSYTPPVQSVAYVPQDSQPDRSHDTLQAPPYSQTQKTYAHLPPVADESSRDTPPSKKYAHLPLVADEMNVKDSPRGGFYSTGIREPLSLHQKKQASKKGLLDILKNRH
jgi:ribosomal protein L37E